MLKALRKRAIALLWCGQAMSAIGDEIYRVTLIWLAVNLIGADTGYLSAAQAAAFLLFGMAGGSWADRWDHFRTMIRVDLLRALVVLIPVILFHFTPISLPILILVAVGIAGLSAFFDPALMATLPRFSEDSESLQAAAGLMATTFRLARAVGPSIVGLLSVLIPMIHFFTLDSATFLISAGSIMLLRRQPTHRHVERAPSHPPSFKESLISGFSAIRDSRTMKVLLFLKSVGGGFWYLVYGLGIALFVQKLAPGDVRAFGFVVASYGIGNLMGALILGNMKRTQPVAMLFGGYLWIGLGFVAMGLAPNLYALALAASWSGFGGPMNDLPMVDLIQSRYPIHEIPKIFRLRLAGEIAANLFFMLISPTLFRIVPVETVIWVVGCVFLLFAAYGYSRLSRLSEPVTLILS